MGSKGSAVVRPLASHQCGPGSNPGVDAICGLSLLLVLSLGPRGFLRVLQFSPLLKNQHFQIPIRSGTHGHVSASSYELLSDPWVNKLQFFVDFDESHLNKEQRSNKKILNNHCPFVDREWFPLWCWNSVFWLAFLERKQINIFNSFFLSASRSMLICWRDNKRKEMTLEVICQKTRCQIYARNSCFSCMLFIKK